MKITFRQVNGVWTYLDEQGANIPVSPVVIEDVFGVGVNEHYTFVTTSKTISIGGTGELTADLRITLRYGAIQRASIALDQDTPFNKGAEVTAFEYEFQG